MEKWKPIFLFIVLISVIGCVASQKEISPTAISESTEIFDSYLTDDATTLAPIPDFLISVYPIGTIAKTEYDKTLNASYFRGIKVEVSAYGISKAVLESKDTSNRIKLISDRVALSIDGEVVPNNLSNVVDELLPDGPFLFSWPVKLELGHHSVKLTFNTDSESMMNYSWSFCIVP